MDLKILNSKKYEMVLRISMPIICTTYQLTSKLFPKSRPLVGATIISPIPYRRPEEKRHPK